MEQQQKRMLGVRLRAARQRAQLSQGEVAEMCELTRQWVSSWERGIGVPSALQLAELSAIYGESAHVLLFGTHFERFHFCGRAYPSSASS